MYIVCIHRIAINAIVVIFTLYLLIHLAKYVYYNFVFFCVMYTVQDIYRKRKIAYRYYEILRKFGLVPHFVHATLFGKAAKRARSLNTLRNVNQMAAIEYQLE